MNNSNPFKKDLQKVKLKLEESIEILLIPNYQNNSIINNKENITKKLFELMTLIDDTIENKPKKLSINSLLPKGFELVQQPGDGTCLYHSIVTSLNLMNINNSFRNGFELREFLVEKLNNIKKEKYLNNTLKGNTLRNNENAIKEIYKVSIRTLFSQLFDNINTFGSNPNEKSILEKFEILKTRIKSKDTWGGQIELLFIAFILKICIYLWDSKTKNWLIFRYEDLASCNLTNSIFIIYNGANHYDCLSPTDTNKFNNNFPMHNQYLRKYNFVKNKENKPVESETKTSNLFKFSNKDFI